MKKIFLILMITNFCLLFCANDEAEVKVKASKNFELMLEIDVAIVLNDVKKLDEILSANEDLLNVQVIYGITALMTAAADNKIDIVDTLLKYKPNLDLQDHDGRTALMHAAYKGHKSIVEVLLKAGANIFVYDREGSNVLDIAQKNNKRDVILSILEHCGNKENIYEIFLLDWSLNGYIESVSKLLSLGEVNINFQKKVKVTPLMAASFSGHLSIVNLLLDLNRHPKAELNLKDEYGWTALTYAVTRGHKAITKSLLEAGADKNIRDKDSRTALDWAYINENDEMVNLLSVPCCNCVIL